MVLDALLQGFEPERAKRSGGPFVSEHAQGERRTADFAKQNMHEPLKVCALQIPYGNNS